MTSLVGVVVRTKDRPYFLARALADIAAQTYPHWRVVVVNDGGEPDEVREIVHGAGSPDRIRVIDVGGSGGRSAAANQGIRALDTEFVVLHDDDDLWDPDFLRVTTDWLGGHPDDGGVVTATDIVIEEQEDSGWVERTRLPFWEGMTSISLSDMLMVNRAVPISFLYRRGLHDEVGWYDEGLDAVEDWDFSLRVLARRPIGFVAGQARALWTHRPTATGSAANSMFVLSQLHARDDRVVRDRALARWITANGPALPLYLAGMEARLGEAIAAHSERLDAVVAEISSQIDAHQPVWSRLRRLRRKLRRRSP